jgi:hypothetical protein
MKATIFFLLLLPSFAFAAVGTVSVSRSFDHYEKVGARKVVEKVTISWTASSSDGSVPDTNIDLKGFVLKAITDPGSTAPTANYDIAFGDPEDTALDAFDGALQNRATATTEQKAVVLSGATEPVFLDGTYQLQITNNLVNSATGTIILYLVDHR